MKHLTLDPSHAIPPTRNGGGGRSALPDAKETKLHPRNPPLGGGENARLMFVGTATTVLYVFAAFFWFFFCGVFVVFLGLRRGVGRVDGGREEMGSLIV